MDVDVYFQISLFDFLIALTMGWGIYKGYKRGFFVQVISFFTLLVAIFISLKLIDWFHIFLSDKSTVRLAQLPVILFALFYIGILIAVHYSGNLVERWTEGVNMGILQKVLGAVFAAFKYTFMIGIVLIFFYRLDTNFDFIPQKEKSRTKLFKPFRQVPPLFFPYLKFNTIHYQPYLLPTDENTPETEDQTDPFDDQDGF